jgi:hypothetical protein
VNTVDVVRLHCILQRRTVDGFVKSPSVRQRQIYFAVHLMIFYEIIMVGQAVFAGKLFTVSSTDCMLSRNCQIHGLVTL